MRALTLILYLSVALFTACEQDDAVEETDSDSEPVDETDSDSEPVDETDSDAADEDGDGYTADVDCDDNNAAIHPGQAEVCDEADNDCDGAVDNDPTDGAVWYADTDGDGQGDADAAIRACEQPAGTVENDTDCDDDDPTAFVGGVEACGGGDEDCDGEVDEAGATGESTFYADDDGDNHGDPERPVSACTLPLGAAVSNDDCDHTRADIHPGAPETCDDADQDCDGEVDEDAIDLVTWYQDLDSDGAGDDAATALACAAPPGYTSTNTDCDDDDVLVNPDATEVCDDGDDNDCDGAKDCEQESCNLEALECALCLNGVVQAGEGCDDGNLINGDGCDNNCTVSECGNGITAGDEACDRAQDCDASCQVPGCGDGSVNGFETCDDGNLVNGDGCDNNCQITACGNGITAGGEACDDGNRINGDGCDNNCTVSECGNGIVAGEEACDPGDASGDDGCDETCRLPGCGDGVTAGEEVCDDGNRINGDGCDNTCQWSDCGNGVVAGEEQCDDGNLDDGDGCSSLCVAEPGSATQCALVLAQWVDLLSGPTPLCAVATDPPAKPLTEPRDALTALVYRNYITPLELYPNEGLFVTFHMNSWKLLDPCGPTGPEFALQARETFYFEGQPQPVFDLIVNFTIDPTLPIDPERPWSVRDPQAEDALEPDVFQIQNFDPGPLAEFQLGPLTRSADATTDPRYCH